MTTNRERKEQGIVKSVGLGHTTHRGTIMCQYAGHDRPTIHIAIPQNSQPALKGPCTRCGTLRARDREEFDVQSGRQRRLDIQSGAPQHKRKGLRALFDKLSRRASAIIQKGIQAKAARQARKLPDQDEIPEHVHDGEGA